MKQRVAAAAIIIGPGIQRGLYETKVKTSTRAEEIYDVDGGFFFNEYMQMYVNSAI